MKKIYSNFGPFITSIIILLLFEFLVLLVDSLRPDHCENPIPREIFVSLTTLLDIIIICTIILCILYFAVGIISYLGSRYKKEKQKNAEFTHRMIVRGIICAIIYTSYYFLSSFIANLYGLCLSSMGPRF